ncbi:hypothetical protein HU200_063415 [Digitaria exilis]|uniref:Uncharacterized protein n=1 Tax=Digitaria exilis TaxID=1010633 RepID=A0A835A1P3_9POAL|nr:hypothetical protein HU200_063415 [Digitaria exilis]
MGKNRGSIAFFGTYRPPVPLDIFSCPADPPPSSSKDELLLTDDNSYNQNGQPIPAAALMELLTFLTKKNPKLASKSGATPEDADKGHVTGMVFVSERDCGLETLHVALRRRRSISSGEVVVKVLSLGDIYGADTFGGVRMEDSGCIAGGFKVGDVTVGHSLVYVSTKEAAKARRTPWTAVYRTDLATGETEQLTPPGQYDLSPAVSPSGKTVAVARFQLNKWNGEIENLKTDIMIIERRQAKAGRVRTDKVIFFHRGFDTMPPSNTAKWAVFRYDMDTGKEERVTPEGIDAMTPAAISETKVAVATIRRKSLQVQMEVEREVSQYRHIEIFDTAMPGKPPVQITQRIRPERDHYNPFVLDGGRRIGYHCGRSDKLLRVQFDKVQAPESHADVGLFRVTGVFPSISKNGKKLAFVDNEFKAVWLADSKGLRIVYEVRSSKSVFSTSWNQNDDLDTL